MNLRQNGSLGFMGKNSIVDSFDGTIVLDACVIGPDINLSLCIRCRHRSITQIQCE